MTHTTNSATGNGHKRAWTWYALAWVPVALIYTMPMSRTRPMPFVQAMVQAVFHVLPPAVLGVIVWRIAGALPWPPRSRRRFIVAHVTSAIVFSTVWLGMEIGGIAIGAGVYAAVEISKSFAEFQAVDGVIMYALIASASYVVRITTRLREQEARTARADTLRMEAELAALRGQLNPHFLFNTLHTLTALVRRDPATAENALERFGDMLRYVLDVKRSAREDVTLGDELEFVRNYLSLEQLRLGDRLRIVENVDPDALDCILPSLTLQPLVENAIKYGIAPRTAGGTIGIGASFRDNMLVLEVSDDGQGAASDIAHSAPGVGLRAVRQRLETRYPQAALLAVATAPGHGFVVHIELPAHTASASAAPLLARGAFV
jgi:two-component system LytT family sensor kinase